MRSCSGKNFHFTLWFVTGRDFTGGFGLPGSWSREGPVPSGASRGEIPGAGGRPRPLPRGRQEQPGVAQEAVADGGRGYSGRASRAGASV